MSRPPENACETANAAKIYPVKLNPEILAEGRELLEREAAEASGLPEDKGADTPGLNGEECAETSGLPEHKGADASDLLEKMQSALAAILSAQLFTADPPSEPAGRCSSFEQTPSQVPATQSRRDLPQSKNLISVTLQLSLSFVSEPEIRRCNLDHRGIDAVTDVLSFPQYAGADEVRAFITTHFDPIFNCRRNSEAGSCIPVLLGDIVICPRRAREQAEEYGHGFERELLYLFVHGALHLLGYDHEREDEKRLMRDAEEAALRTVK
jgi:probable rRNA maturation factor